MLGEPVLPSTTLAIVLGASEWPYAPELPALELFARSAEDFTKYLLSTEGFGLPERNLINLFNVSLSPNELEQAISTFLLSRQEELCRGVASARDLIVFYVGHGGFTPGDRQYFLALRSTRTSREGPSSLRMSDFANTLRNDAQSLRRYLILDCCFAASAYKEFQSISGPAEAARIKTLDEMPTTGTALLCASSSRDVAVAPLGAQHTMFSGALLEALHKGDRDVKHPLSLGELGTLVQRTIRDRYPNQAVRPQVDSPDKRQGDIAHIPVFPNAAVGEQNQEDGQSSIGEGALAPASPQKPRAPLLISGPVERTWIARVFLWYGPSTRLGLLLHCLCYLSVVVTLISTPLIARDLGSTEASQVLLVWLLLVASFQRLARLVDTVSGLPRPRTRSQMAFLLYWPDRVATRILHILFYLLTAIDTLGVISSLVTWRTDPEASDVLITFLVLTAPAFLLRSTARHLDKIPGAGKIQRTSG